MAKTYFISDLHLQAAQPALTDLFLRFLAMQMDDVEALYILGDFFEAWIGDDDESEFITKIKQALKQVASRGVEIYLMAGNRDFLLGQRFAQAAGCHLLSDPTVIDLYGQHILLTHGDVLCSDDVKHQKFRRLTQNSLVKSLFLALPLSWRRNIATQIRRKSQARTQSLAMNIMDVNQSTVQSFLNHFAVPQLIHGHTHRAGIHQWDGGKRIVLGAWSDHQGNALKCELNKDPILQFFPNNHCKS